jgi:hypothetical protein
MWEEGNAGDAYTSTVQEEDPTIAKQQRRLYVGNLPPISLGITGQNVSPSLDCVVNHYLP